MAVPFKNHWYTGVVPPLTGVAVKVTGVPSQTGSANSTIETLTGSNGLTVMVSVLEVAGFPEVQVSPEARTQVSELPFDGVKE